MSTPNRKEEALLEVAQELKTLVSFVEYKQFEHQVAEFSIDEAIAFAITRLCQIKYAPLPRKFTGPLTIRQESTRLAFQQGRWPLLMANLHQIETALAHGASYTLRSYWLNLVKAHRVPLEELFLYGVELQKNISNGNPRADLFIAMNAFYTVKPQARPFVNKQAKLHYNEAAVVSDAAGAVFSSDSLSSSSKRVK